MAVPHIPHCSQKLEWFCFFGALRHIFHPIYTRQRVGGWHYVDGFSDPQKCKCDVCGWAGFLFIFCLKSTDSSCVVCR